MFDKATKPTIPSTTTSSASANKDLSCLRCRKKKAKCSKTRPTCTRCARSNQPCEYPDAPPNLTDLSQKVLTLYDTLRELEGEFLVKYMQSPTIDQDGQSLSIEKIEGDEFMDLSDDDVIDDQFMATSFIDESSSNYNNTSQSKYHYNNTQAHIQPIEREEEATSTEEPSGWSMSLTSDGLTIQAVTRNFSEFNEFIKHISRQTLRDFGPEYLPKNWDPDAEGCYFQESDPEGGEEEEEEELDEDEYLVKVPVISTSELLLNNSQIPKEATITKLDVGLSLSEIAELIEHHLPHMLQHLSTRYKWIQSLNDNPEQMQTAITTPPHHHVVMLLLQLQPYLPNNSTPTNATAVQEQQLCTNILVQISILTAYVVSMMLLPEISITNLAEFVSPPLPVSFWHVCADHATLLLMDVVLQQQQQHHDAYPISLCATLLAWTNMELIPSITDSKADSLIYLALRIIVFCSDDWKKTEKEATKRNDWQILIAAVLYLDVYSSIFYFHKKPQLRGEGAFDLWKKVTTAAVAATHVDLVPIRDCSVTLSRQDHQQRSNCVVVLEARLMSLLSKVVSLFYQVEKEDKDELPDTACTERSGVRKIDVDEVLTLVRDVELWEQELPDWAKWDDSKSDDQSFQARAKIHMHMVHNMAKILLFRPFSTTDAEKEMTQTFTKSTFLDMSSNAAERLVTCVEESSSSSSSNGRSATCEIWVRASSNLARDVIGRVLNMFDKDEEIVDQMNKVQQRLELAESKQ